MEPPLSLDQLRNEAEAGRIDTVLLALTDMQGRLQGKRLTAPHFLDEVVEHGAEACNYLLAVDVEMNTVDGYAMSSWERGYGDFEMVPDLDTLRPVPWHEGTALCLADIRWADGTPVGAVAAPGPARPARPARRARAGARTPAPSSSSSSTATPTRRRSRRATAGLDAGQPLQRRLLAARHGAGRAADPPHPQRDGAAPACAWRAPRASATTASTRSTSATATALQAADEHVIYKTGAKEIAAQEGMAITFMAKLDEREGSSCHIHLSLRARGRRVAVRGRRDRVPSASWPASSPACAS